MSYINVKSRLIAKNNTIFNIILISVLVIYGYFYFFALTDLSEKAYWLFMDERISYDGIFTIYHPDSFKGFFDSLFFGGDLRYGRLFWNMNALISYIPHLIFGEQGQIIATRFAQMVFLFLAYYILIKTFVENRYHQLIAFVVLITLPNTAYFIIEPKPEPLQLFFLSMFLMYAFKNHWRIKPYIILLGIGLGLKISLIPITFILILCFIYLNRSDVFFKREFSNIKLSAISLSFSILLATIYLKFIESKIVDLLGVNSPYYQKIISRPSLNKLASTLVGFSTQTSYQLKFIIVFFIILILSTLCLMVYRNISNNILKLFLNIFFGVVICTPCILLIPINFKYLGFLIANNKLDHGADMASINYVSWLKFTFFEIFNAPFLVIFSIVFLPIISFAFMSFKYKNKAFIFKGLLLFCMILLSLMPIFLNVKRLWAHYVHVGFVIVIIFYFFNLKYYKKTYAVLLILLVPFIMILFGTKQTIHNFEIYSTRTKSVNFKLNNDEYVKSIELLNNYDLKNKVIVWDPTLYFPDRLKKDYLAISYSYDINQLHASNSDFIILNAKSELYTDFNKVNFISNGHLFELLKSETQIYKVFKKVL